MMNPVTASAGGAEPFGAERFASEPASYWRDSSGPVLLAQASSPADSGASNRATGTDTAGATPSAPPPPPAPSTKVSPSPSATSDSGSSAQVLPITPTPTHVDTLQTAPATTTVHDSLHTTTATHDSLHTATLPDSLHARPAMSDSLHARSTAPETLRATSARPETLFAPVPHGVSAKPTTPAASPPKQRTGLLGVSPIAILLALAVVHYFVTKSVD